MDNMHIAIKSFLNKLEGYHSKEPYPQRSKACITYNQEKTDILDWGEKKTFKANEKDVHIDKFMDKLYLAYKKGKDNWDQDDLFFINSISDFLRLKIRDSEEYHKTISENSSAFHYVFIVPSGWEHEIREELIRPIFIRSNLISSDDHKNRLLFFTDLESIFCYLQDRRYANIRGKNQVFKRGEQNILFRVALHRDGTFSVKLDLIDPQYSLVDVTDATLFPRVVRSAVVSINLDDFKDSIKTFLKARMFSGDISNFQEGVLLNRMTDHVLEEFSSPKYLRYDIEADYSQKALCNITDIKEWNLSLTQMEIINSITIADICEEMNKKILGAIRDLLENNFGKRRTLVMVHEYYFSRAQQSSPLLLWMRNFSENKERNSSYNSMLETSKYESTVRIFISELMTGAANKVAEVLRDSNLHALPYVLPKSLAKISQDAPSSIFINSEPNAIVNIDISFKSTSLSFSLLNKDGTIQNIFDNTYFTCKKRIPSLSSFLKVEKNKAILKMKSQTIFFMENQLYDHLKYFSKYDIPTRTSYQTIKIIKSKRTIPKLERNFLYEFFFGRRTKLLSEIEAILNDTSFSAKEIPILNQQSKYIKVFFVMYLAYVNEVIEKGLPDIISGIYGDLKIGHLISVEKKLLDNVIGTKEEFKEMIFASGLVKHDDNWKKLKIITQGEGSLPLLQQSSKSLLPLKSHYVLAQLRDDYLQLTLNQVIESTSLEGKSSAIIVSDKIIPTPNIHDSLCMNLWDQIINSDSLIHLCGHEEHKYKKMFSLKTKEKFFITLKAHISNNILGEKSKILMNKKLIIQLGSNCNCSVHLSFYDIIDFAFRPTLENMINILSASLINTNLFGNFMEIQHIFCLIHFNNNPRFQKVLVDLLAKESKDYIEIKNFFIIPDFPNQLSLPIVQRKPFLHECFTIGNLHQVSRETYGFSVTQFKRGYDKITPLYTDKQSNTETIKLDENHIIPLLKKGDIIYNSGLNKTFYLEKQEKSKNNDPKKLTSSRERTCICLYKLKNLDNQKMESEIPLDKKSWDKLKDFLQELELTGYENTNRIPIMISMRPKDYSSSLEFSMKIVGQNIVSNQKEYFDVGEPITLARF